MGINIERAKGITDLFQNFLKSKAYFGALGVTLEAGKIDRTVNYSNKIFIIKTIFFTTSYTCN